MIRFNSTGVRSLIGAIIILFSSCTDKPGDKEETKKTTETKVARKQVTSYKSVDSWIDDLRNFRSAVAKNDLEKMKTYFNFPIVEDSTQIWAAVYDGVEDDKKPKEYRKLFTADDFKVHHASLFNQPFIKGLDQLNLDQLYKYNAFTTADIKGQTAKYHMLASFDQPTAMVQLAVTFSGELDEEGSEISETEHATIYFFKVENGKYLKFDKVLFAG